MVIPTHLSRQVEVQTPGGTHIGDIVLTREQGIQELKALTENMEKDLQESSVITVLKEMNRPLSLFPKRRYTLKKGKEGERKEMKRRKQI